MVHHIPNLVTLSRILFIPLIAWALHRAHAHPGEGFAAAAFLLTSVAASTDWVDGYLARRFNWITNFGKIADAFVDKLLVLGLYTVLLLEGILPFWGWLIVGLTLLRDVLVTGLRAAAARRGKFLAAGRSGKLKTVVQLTALVLLFAAPALLIDGAVWWTRWPESIRQVGDLLFYAGMACFLASGWLTLSSGWQYLKAYRPLLKTSSAPEPSRK